MVLPTRSDRQGLPGRSLWRYRDKTSDFEIWDGVSRRDVLEIPKGNVPGHSTTFMLARTPDTGLSGTDTFEPIWDQAGQFTYLTTKSDLFLSSSSGSDTQVVQLIGLTENGSGDWIETTTTATLTGQTQVQITGDWIRVFQISNFDTTDFVGDIYLAETDTLTGGVPDTASKIKSKILIGNNISRNARITSPKEYFAYFDRLENLENVKRRHQRT